MTAKLPLFFYFTKSFVAIEGDIREPVPDSIKEMDWDRLFRFCEEQAVLGVGYKELEKLVYKGMSIPKLLKFTWYAAYEQIAARNRELNTKAVEVCREYEREGFRCCLLKGQGNAAMYPDPLSRAPGDVDIFVIERSNDRKAITEYVRKRHEVADIRYHHIEYESDGILVEIHFTPCIMNNPLYNRRLQRWIYNDFKTTQINIGDSQYPITVPTVETNIIFMNLKQFNHHRAMGFVFLVLEILALIAILVILYFEG